MDNIIKISVSNVVLSTSNNSRFTTCGYLFSGTTLKDTVCQKVQDGIDAGYTGSVIEWLTTFFKYSKNTVLLRECPTALENHLLDNDPFCFTCVDTFDATEILPISQKIEQQSKLLVAKVIGDAQEVSDMFRPYENTVLIFCQEVVADENNTPLSTEISELLST